jgi:hypothetical protein
VLHFDYIRDAVLGKVCYKLSAERFIPGREEGFREDLLSEGRSVGFPQPLTAMFVKGNVTIENEQAGAVMSKGNR